MTTKALGFTGRVGGVTYTDPTLFEQAAKALGFRGHGVRQSWKLGADVVVTLADGTKVAGQVWSRSHQRDWVWVALENDTFVAVNTRSGVARVAPDATDIWGRVA